MDRYIDLQNEDTTLKIFADNLNRLMQEHDMSQADLAREIHMSTSIVN